MEQNITAHGGFSLIAKIKPGNTEIVRDLLREMNQSPGASPKMPLGLCKTVHFCSGVVIPDQEYQGEMLPATLLLATSYWGSRVKHLEEWVGFCGDGLRDLLCNCEGFPEGKRVTDNALKKYMEEHRHRDAFYSGMHHVTHEDIGRENLLREEIQDFIDREQTENMNISAMEWRERIREHIKCHPDFSWARIIPRKTMADYRILYGAVAIFGLVLLAFLANLVWLLFDSNALNASISTVFGVLLVAFVLLILSIRHYEKQPQMVAGRQPDEHVRRVSSTQNHPVINEMTVAGPLKKGWLRPLFFRIALRAVNMARALITIKTVATARWIAIDGGRRLVFISNFTNLSESYVRDFIDKKGTARQINLLFGQGEGYPVTRWIMGDGALKDPVAFVNEVFMNQHVTEFWYWPYQKLSVDNININRKIRMGLFADLDESETLEWLKLL